eukprot:gene1806-64868_t
MPAQQEEESRFCPVRSFHEFYFGILAVAIVLVGRRWAEEQKQEKGKYPAQEHEWGKQYAGKGSGWSRGIRIQQELNSHGVKRKADGGAAEEGDKLVSRAALNQ